MPILKLKAVCKDYIWGGRRLMEEFGKTPRMERMAESWELSGHPDGPSVIANGEYAGRTLPEYIEGTGGSVLGSRYAQMRELPLLIKLIDARSDLSVQVHPDDAYARAHGERNGKTEMWYVLSAEPGAFLYCGFSREITREEFSRRIAEGTLTEVLRKIPVQSGTTVFVPAGTIHAICRGILLAEIQQSSNVTYRVFDYGRPGADGKPRPLHIPQALEVTRLDAQPPRCDFGGHLAACPYFTVDIWNAPREDVCGGESFVSVLVLDGEGELRCGGESMSCRKGDSFFLPAGSGIFSIVGSAQALVTRAGQSE